MSVGLIYHPIYLEHDTGLHCEVASRLITTMSHLKKVATIDKLIPIKPQAATLEQDVLNLAVARMDDLYQPTC